MKLTLSCLWMSLSLAWTFPSGPPINSTVCTDMVPSGHGYNARTDALPYEWILDSTMYQEGTNVEVSIIPSTNQTNMQHYEGLFVQARCQSASCDRKNMAVGTFQTSDPELKLNECHGLAKSAVSHNSKSHKNMSTFSWIPPKGFRGPIKFMATVVRETDIFWVDEMSIELTYKQTSSGTMAAVNFMIICASVFAIFC